MTKLGILVGEKGNWNFFNDIFAYLNQYYTTDVYRQKVYNTPLLHGRLNRWSFLHGISRLLRQSDVCFFEWASELLVPASHMPKSCPIVTRLHSYELYAWAPLVNWDRVDKVILVSRAMQEKFCQLYPDHAHKTEVVYNAKPLDIFKPDPNRKFNVDLGMLCEINPRKRVYEVIEMVAELKQRGVPAHLHIAGSRKHAPDVDEYFVAVHRLVEKLNLQDSVTFYDHVQNTHEWLQQIDIFISNSYWEGHQVALVEAMASGCYSLSHFWDGAEEVLPPENLYALEAELQEKIITYCHMPAEERKRRQQHMRTIACEKYDAQKQHLQIREIIETTRTGSVPNASRQGNVRR